MFPTQQIISKELDALKYAAIFFKVPEQLSAYTDPTPVSFNLAKD